MKLGLKWAPVLLALWLSAVWPLVAQAQNGDESRRRAGLVVMLQDGSVETRCVAFPESSISGYELLLRAGLVVEVQVAAMGAMVCAIEGTGCPAADCLCQCRGNVSCVYWSYWRLEAESWQYGRAGATVSQVSDGAVEGWAWGAGSVSSASPPPLYTFEEICQGPGLSETTEATPSAPAAATPAVSPATNSPAASYLVFGLLVAGLAAAGFLLRHRDTKGAANRQEK